jgi:hypothetical protein
VKGRRWEGHTEVTQVLFPELIPPCIDMSCMMMGNAGCVFPRTPLLWIDQNFLTPLGTWNTKQEKRGMVQQLSIPLNFHRTQRISRYSYLHHPTSSLSTHVSHRVRGFPGKSAEFVGLCAQSGVNLLTTNRSNNT